MGEARRLWHYTMGDSSRWGRIQREGIIKLSTANAQPGERHAVWCSYREPWEPTASKLPQFTLQGRVADSWALAEHARRCGSVIRIGVDPAAAPLTFAEWSRDSGVSRREIRWLERQTKKLGGDTRVHRASFEPIPRSAWTGVEVWTLETREWRPLESIKRARSLLSWILPGADRV